MNGDLIDFSKALEALKEGYFLQRESWNGKNQSVFLKKPLESDIGTPTVPYLVLINAQRDLVPWVPSTGDLFAGDWRILSEVEASA